MAASIPVLTYHSVAPGERIDPRRFGEHLDVLAGSDLPSLLPADLDDGAAGLLLTFDDGHVDFWTHALPLLRERGMKAVVFVIPERAGDGDLRRQGETVYGGGSQRAHAEAAAAGGAHPGFLRWTEMEAAEATGLVEIQSHSHSHRMAWVGDEIVGFHLGDRVKPCWYLAETNQGDCRAGVPLYRRGSALAHRVYRDDPGLRDHLADWLTARGGEDYVTARGAEAVNAELAGEARAYREANRAWNGWETAGQRSDRTVEEIARAREVLEGRLGGVRDQLCLPWGEYDSTTLECARRAGVRRVYTLDRRPNPACRIGFAVHRFEPRPRGAAWLRSRLWLYRSTGRTAAYAWFTGKG